MLYAIIAVLIIITDQLLKYWVTLNIPLNEGIVNVIPGVISLVNIHNKGAAFGMLQNGRVLFIIIAVVFIAIVVYALASNIIRAPLGRWSAVGVLAGAIGNCIDRIMNGYVVDMFKLEFINHAIFNIADVFISVCGVIFCIYIILGKDEEPEFEAEPVSEKQRRPNVKELRALSRQKAAEEKEPLGRRDAGTGIRKLEEGESIPALRRKFETERNPAEEVTPLPEQRRAPAPPKRPMGVDSRNARPAQRKEPVDDEMKRHGAISTKERRTQVDESANPFAKWDLATKRAPRDERAPRAESARPRYPEMQRPIDPPAQRPVERIQPFAVPETESKPESFSPAQSQRPEAPPPMPEARRPEPSKGTFDLEDILAEFR